LRKVTSLAVAGLTLALGVLPVQAADYRAAGRAAGGDRATALRVAHVLLARPLALQLTRVRCERVGAAGFCGLVLEGTKFHRRVDTAAFRSEVDGLVRAAFAVDASLAEVDLWVTVPAASAEGAVVTGDFALPAAKTVFATTVPRALAAHPSENANVFWDPTFRSKLAQGSTG
jgi:hypothetical protein